jgi:hypothetical protein
MDAAALNYDATATVNDQSACTFCVYGCTDATQSNYDASATCDDGSCIPFTYGCTDPAAVNYNLTATADDGSCLYPGCMDVNALNYDATATFDDGSCTYGVPGCTDATALNYDALATVDDGSCAYPTVCDGAVMTGMFVDRIIDDRVFFNFNNMNTFDANGNELCRIDEMKIKYRPIGTTTWFWKTMGSPTGYNVNGFCNSTQLTEKEAKMLTMDTEYEWYMRIWYCSGIASGWEQGPNFFTAPECPVVGNLTVDPVTNPNNGISKATFTWDDSNGAFVFCRIKLRPEGIATPVASDWLNVGGGNVPYGTFSSIKYGLTPGQSYRGQAKGHCDPTGHPAYNSLTWTPLIFWTQPSLRMDGGTAIANLDVYPNPSRDVFNVAFTSDDVQDLEVRVVNIVGEVIYTEDLQQFVGEYTKSLDLATYTKGVYFLEITTNNGVVNKKLILQ